jgi:hypothetical protein
MFHVCNMCYGSDELLVICVMYVSVWAACYELLVTVLVQLTTATRGLLVMNCLLL